MLEICASSFKEYHARRVIFEEPSWSNDLTLFEFAVWEMIKKINMTKALKSPRIERNKYFLRMSTRLKMLCWEFVALNQQLYLREEGAILTCWFFFYLTNVNIIYWKCNLMYTLSSWNIIVLLKLYYVKCI